MKYVHKDDVLIAEDAPDSKAESHHVNVSLPTKRGAVVCAMLGVTLSRSALAAFVAQCIALT